MNLNIASKEQILKEAIVIDSFLQETMSEMAEESVMRGNDLAVYIARTGKMLADAKYHLSEAKKDEVLDVLRETAKNAKATSKATNALIDSICKEEQYLVDWCERLNRSATHQLDWCRTLISKAKEEMRLSPQMYNSNNKIGF